MAPFTKSEMEAIRRATRDEDGVRRDFWTKLKRVGRHIPFARGRIGQPANLLASVRYTGEPALVREAEKTERRKRDSDKLKAITKNWNTNC